MSVLYWAVLILLPLLRICAIPWAVWQLRNSYGLAQDLKVLLYFSIEGTYFSECRILLG